MTPRERYEAETGKKAIVALSDTGKNVYRPSYTKWLEAQLTWRPVSEKPKEAGIYFVEAKPYTGCESTVITTAYFDGESFLWHAVARWLPIPPMEEER